MKMCTIIVLSSMIFASLSCKKNNTPPFYISTTINGKPVSFSSEMMADTFPYPLSVSGYDPKRNQTILLQLAAISTSKVTIGEYINNTTYQFGIFIYLNQPDSNRQYFTSGRFPYSSVTINAINNSYVQGSFQDTLAYTFGNFDSIIIAGKFSVAF
jgi:hypothetical protein